MVLFEVQTFAIFISRVFRHLRLAESCQTLAVVTLFLASNAKLDGFRTSVTPTITNKCVYKITSEESYGRRKFAKPITAKQDMV